MATSSPVQFLCRGLSFHRPPPSFNPSARSQEAKKHQSSVQIVALLSKLEGDTNDSTKRSSALHSREGKLAGDGTLAR